MTVRVFAWTTAVSQRVLRGLSQVFLQAHAGMGGCLLAAVAWQSLLLALGCLLGALAGTLCGQRLGARVDADDAGLHGYNGALVGIGVLTVLPPTGLAWALVIVLSCLATWLAQAWRRHLPVSPYTAPFVLMIWLLQALIPLTGWLTADVVPPGLPADGWGGVANAVLRGVGQVMFLADPWAGAVCLLGLALAGPRVLIRALLASAAASGLAWAGGFPDEAVLLGLYGFNAVLLVEAVHQALPGRFSALCLGVCASLLFMRAFQWLDLPPLTAPFVLATWLTCGVYRVRR
ncbi:MAG: urea transporter [Castellaniella sp.]|uniref:urea transporter n=1 Tax=Castellaniella sp. TaxID=1955812 RepID=UPI003C7709B4